MVNITLSTPQVVTVTVLTWQGINEAQTCFSSGSNRSDEGGQRVGGGGWSQHQVIPQSYMFIVAAAF